MGRNTKSLKLNRRLSSVAAVKTAQGDTGQKPMSLESNATMILLASLQEALPRTGAVPAFGIHSPVFTCSPGTHCPLKPREPLRPALQNTVTAYPGQAQKEH